MEAENNDSIKDVMIILNTNYIRNNNIVLRAIFTSIRYLSQENTAFSGTECKMLRVNSSNYLLKLRKNEIPQLESWLHNIN